MNRIFPLIVFLLCLGLSPVAHRQKPVPAFRYDFAPSTGELKLLVLLMRFPDDEPELSPGRFEEIFFSKGKMPSGSVAEYFTESSYGGLRITGEVRGWYTAEHSHAYYAGGKGGHDAGLYPSHMSRLVEEAVAMAGRDGVDFSTYDNSGDGHVDGLIIIHSGRGMDTSGNPDHLWTTTHYLSMGKTTPIGITGKTIDRYSIIQEIRKPGRELPIGFICHELGHMMGLPDLGDKDGTSAGIGWFGVMGSGFWGNHDPTRPFHFCAWSKVKLGWVEPEVISNDTTVTIPDVETHLVAYRLNTSDPNEYFLLENRRKKGYDSELFSEGILIWHVDERVLTENKGECIGRCPYHYIVALEQADGMNDLEKNRNKGDSKDFFSLQPGSNSRWAGDTGTGKIFMEGAHSITYDREFTGLSVKLLSESNGEITAEIRVSDRSSPSPSSPLVSIADFRLEDLTNEKDRTKGKKEKIALYLKIRNMGAPAKRVRVLAEGPGIWLKRSKTGLGRLETGQEAWLEKPFVFNITRDFGQSRRTVFRFEVASNRGGYREALSIPVTVGRPEIIIVDDSDRDVSFFYFMRLNEMKESFWGWKVSERGLPTSAELRRFPILIWLAPLGRHGAESIMDDTRKSLLKDYLESGGNLLLVAPDLNFQNDEILPGMLHIESARPEGGAVRITGVDGDVISRNQRTGASHMYYPRINPQSSLVPASDAEAIYRDFHDRVIGVRFPKDREAGHRVVVLSFPFEALGPGPQRQILERIFKFFRTPVGAPVADRLAPKNIPAGTGRIKLNVSGINFQPGMEAGFKEKDLRVESINVLGPQSLEIVLDIDKTASPGNRTLTLRNPGMDIMEFPEAIMVMESSTPGK